MANNTEQGSYTQLEITLSHQTGLPASDGLPITNASETKKNQISITITALYSCSSLIFSTVK